MRPDYERLKEIMPTEIELPLIYTTMYNFPWFKTFCKLMDLGTTATNINEFNEIGGGGIWMDIFPLDFDRNPNISYSEEMELVFKTQEELLKMVLRPQIVLNEIKDGSYQPVLPPETLTKLAAAPREVPFKLYEDFSLAHFNDTDYCSRFSQASRYNVPLKFFDCLPVPKAWFGEGTTLLFEGLPFPCPVDYESHLTTLYGDWREPKRFASAHQAFRFSVDMSYEEYIRTAKYINL